MSKPASRRELELERGRAARQQVSRVSHARWPGRPRNFDPLPLVIKTCSGRIPALVRVKFGRMAVSPFAFFRGAVALMAADLNSLPHTGLHCQLCGDAHVRNLGFFAAPDGRITFDLNDFDETVFGPWEWDVKRLATSIVLAGREAGDKDALCQEAALAFLRSYKLAMKKFSRMTALALARYRVQRNPRIKPLNAALLQAERDTPLATLRKLTRKTGGAWRFREQRPLLYRPREAERKQVLAALALYHQTLSPVHQHLLDVYSPADVAFKVVGTGSVGLRDYLVVLFGNDTYDPLFLQVKEEPASAYAPYLPAANKYLHEGRRVVEGQRAMQTQSDFLLGWTAIAGRDYLVRQFHDHKATISVAQLRGRNLVEYAQVCGEVLAKGHGRSGHPAALFGYMGAGSKLENAMAKFALAYADQTERDYQRFCKAARAGRIEAVRA